MPIINLFQFSTQYSPLFQQQQSHFDIFQPILKENYSNIQNTCYLQYLQILLIYFRKHMFIKEAVMNVGRRFFPEKDVAMAQNNLILQFLFLTTLKNYLYSWIAQQKPLVISNQIKAKAAKSRLILVLDMDQTLVHTRRKTAPNHCNYVKTSVTFQGQDMYVQPRPYAKQFLQSLSQVFTIYIYTAGKKKYADTVLKVIDPKNLIDNRFYRDSCKKSNGTLVKDLKYIRKTLKIKQEMILVDDNALSVEMNSPFAVKIEAFQGNQEDKELLGMFQRVLRFYK